MSAPLAVSVKPKVSCAALRPNSPLMPHWRVENDCFNSLDVQWREDSGLWCTKGNAVLGLSLLRVMAYNLAQMLRRRRLRRKTEDGNYLEPPSWRSLFKAIMLTLETALDGGEAALAVG